MRKIYIVAALFAFATLSMFQKVQSNGNKPPVGRAGAPPSYSTCYNGCHNGTAVNGGGGNVKITFSGANNQYQVSTAYTVSVVVTDNLSKGGFECMALDNTLAQAGSFTVTNTANTSLQTSGGKQYIGHKSASTTKSWSFTWTSPATAPTGGRIVFYATGNGANGNNSDSGDHIYTDSLVVTLGSCSPPDAVSINGTASYCAGQTTNLQINSTCTDCTYSWSDGQSGSSINVGVAGTYTVTATNGCGSAVSSGLVITENATPTVTVSASGNVLSAQASDAVSYQWFLDGTPINGATSADYTPSGAGNYSVTITASNGCTATSSNFALGINDSPLAHMVNIYPLLIDKAIYINALTPALPLSYNIYSLNGQRLMQGTMANQQNELNLAALPAGIYLLQLNAGANRLTQRIVKQ